MINQGPFTLTGPTSYPDPFATTGGQAAAVQVQNQSGTPMTVLASGQNVVIQSFTSQTIPTGGGNSITITPGTQLSSSATDSVFLVWLLAGEQPSTPDGQLTAAAISAAFSASNGSPTDLSGTIVTPDTSTLLAPADTSRTWYLIQNLSSANIWINFGAAATGGEPSILLAAGQGLTSDPTFTPSSAIYGYAVTANAQYALKVF